MRAPHIIRQEQGTSAVEVALIAPVLITLLVGIIEVCMIMFVTLTMDVAVSNTARTGKTGYTTAGQTQAQTITAQLNQELGGLIDTTKLSITTTAYSSASQIGVAAGASGSYGTSGQVVVYQVSYDWPLLTPVLSQLIGHNGLYTITVSTMVKNEPYGS